MKILDNAIIKDHYEVIVIGAGNGGLTAAALLAKKGVDVLVIEQHYIPGGAVTALRRKDITCDVGAAILFGWVPNTYNPHYYIMNELEEPIDLVHHKSVFSMYWGTKDKPITFWRNLDKFLDELTAAFPEQAQQLRDYYKFMMRCYRGILKGNMPMAPTDMPLSLAFKMFCKHPFATIRLLPLLKTSGGDIIEKFGLNNTDYSNFADMCMGLFTCTKMAETPQVIPNSMFADMHIGGASYPVGSPQMLPNKLERALERYGGHIIQRQLVKEILFDTTGKKPKAIGVKLANGLEIKADQVLSNADVYHLYGKLIKPELCDPEKLKFYQGMRPTTSAMILYMGVDKEAIPKDRQNIEFLIEDKKDFYNNVYVFIPSLDDHSIVPDDAHSLTVMYPGPAHAVNWPTPGDPFYQSEEYNKLKDEWAQKAIQKLEGYYEGISKRIRFCEVATPSTLERFLMKHKGNVGGPAQVIGQEMLKRPRAKLKDFKNLFMAGDSTTMGEGVVSTAASGVSAANRILKAGGYGKQYLPHKFKKNVVNLMEEGPKKIPVPTDQEQLTEATAKRLAQQCQWCLSDKDACRHECPAGIDVLNFIRRVEAGNYGGAVRLMRDMNPLAEICGYVCPSEKICEKNCERLKFSERSMQVKRLQAWVCAQAGKDGFEKYLPEPNGKKVAVIGAGPGGISCAHFLARLGYNIDLFDKKEKPGGMIRYVIPSFRLPADVIEREFNGVLISPISFKGGKEFGKDVLIEDLSKSYDAVFLAPGLWQGRKLKLSGIEDKDMTDALSFISEYRDKGTVSVKNSVLIVGGGSVAADAASVAKKAGSKKISLICLESEEEMPMLDHEWNELKAMDIVIFNSLGPKAVKNGKLSCIQCKSVFDQKGNFCPEFNESVLKEVPFEQLIMAVGQGLDPSLAQYLEKSFGTSKLKVDPNTQLINGQKNVYAGGDIIRGAGTVVQAVGDGRRAARDIHEKLLKNY